jgi:excisionase family DNA binding protein
VDEITAAQAALLTGVSERTIRRKIASGVIQARRLGRNRYAIKVSDLRVSRPFEALALRVEVLEQRLARLEAQLLVTAGTAQPGIRMEGGAAPLPLSPQFASAEFQQLFAQLAYETARLARSISLPEESPQATASGQVNDEESSKQPVPGQSTKRQSGEAV